MNVVLRLTEAAVEFLCGWGLQSHFRVQPNHCVEVVICCVGVGVVTNLRPSWQKNPIFLKFMLNFKVACFELPSAAISASKICKY